MRSLSPRFAKTEQAKEEPNPQPAQDLHRELKSCMEEVLPPMLKDLLTQERTVFLQRMEEILESEAQTPKSPMSNKPAWAHHSSKPRKGKAVKRQTCPTSFLTSLPLPCEDAGPQLPAETCGHVVPPSSHQHIEFFFQSRGSTYSTREVFIPLAQEIFTPLAQDEMTVPAVILPTQGFLRWVPSRRALEEFTRGAFWEHVFGVLILVYSVFLGMETQWLSVNDATQEAPPWYSQYALIFAAIFTCEILFRAAVQRVHFFTQEPTWNIFDALALGVQILVQLLLHMPPTSLSTSMLLWLRPLRVIRLIRVIRNFESLRSITVAIGGSMQSLCTTLIILCIVLYACSIIFTQISVGSRQNGSEHQDELELWFGDLPRTSLTLAESILGGFSWDEAIRPLMTDVGPVAAVVFCWYILFSIFAILNMVTGVYVDKATRIANADKDLRFVKNISNLFNDGNSTDAGITWEIFEAKLSEEEMQEYFRDIDVDPSQAYVLFQLLDVDRSGEVDTSEMIDGLIRLHGHAKALDIRICQYELWSVHEDLKQQHKALGSAVEDIVSILQQMMGTDEDAPVRKVSRADEDGASTPSSYRKVAGRRLSLSHNDLLHGRRMSLSNNDFALAQMASLDNMQRQTTPSSLASEVSSTAPHSPQGVRLNLKRNAKRRTRSVMYR